MRAVEVAGLVRSSIVRNLADAPRAGWDQGLGPASGEQSADRVAVVTAIGDQALERAEALISAGAVAMSEALPGVSRIRRGRPCSSVAAWSLLVWPPRKRPMAWKKAPFCVSRRAMLLDVRSIDSDRVIDRALPSQRLEHGQPDALSAPAIEAVVDGRVGSILERGNPAGARPSAAYGRSPR